MMMTSGQAVKYKSSFHCFTEIMKNEGAKSLFKGAGANILRAVAGAGVLSGYDQMQVGGMVARLAYLIGASSGSSWPDVWEGSCWLAALWRMCWAGRQPVWLVAKGRGRHGLAAWRAAALVHFAAPAVVRLVHVALSHAGCRACVPRVARQLLRH